MGIGCAIYPRRKAGGGGGGGGEPAVETAGAGSPGSIRQGPSGLVGVRGLLLPGRPPARWPPLRPPRCVRRARCVRRGAAESLSRLRRCRALSDTRLDLPGKVEQLTGRAPGADDALEQVDGVLRGDAQRRQRRRHPQGQRRVVGRVARMHQLLHLFDAESCAERVRPALHHVRVRLPARSERVRREGERDGHSPHRIRAPRAVTATMLLRRPKPSSTPGAAGSATHCSPSTTKAYWWCPWGNASVMAQTPPPPTRTNGDAFRSHWLKVPATATCFAVGAYSTNRTYTLSRAARRAGRAPLGPGDGRVRSKATAAAAASAVPQTTQGRSRSRSSMSRGSTSPRQMRRIGERARRRTSAITRPSSWTESATS